MNRADPTDCRSDSLTLDGALATLDWSHRQTFRSQLLVIKLSLFQRSTPDLGTSFSVDASGQSPGSISIHAGKDLAQALHHMLKRVDVIVEHDHSGFWIALGCPLAFKNRCGTG